MDSTYDQGLCYSEVPNRRACSLRFFRFSFHPARNFSCNKQKIPPCLFIDLLSKKAGKVEFFSNHSHFFQCALLLWTSEYMKLLRTFKVWWNPSKHFTLRILFTYLKAFIVRFCRDGISMDVTTAWQINIHFRSKTA